MDAKESMLVHAFNSMFKNTHFQSTKEAVAALSATKNIFEKQTFLLEYLSENKSAQ